MCNQPRGQKVRRHDIAEVLFLRAPPHSWRCFVVIEVFVAGTCRHAEDVVGIGWVGFIAEDGAEGCCAVGAAY